MDAITRLAEMIEKSHNIVFMTGAGMSTESGISDFRSENGIFNTIKKYGRSPEELLSHSFFTAHPDKFYEYYKPNFLLTDIEPNAGHNAIVKLEKEGRVRAVVTQNVDGLHTKAGSKNVYELHGTIYRNYCVRCGKEYTVDDVKNCDGVPHCTCGGVIRPDIVLYEEPLDDYTIRAASQAVTEADMLIVCGTSLVVYPAAGLVPMYSGERLVIINKTETPYDRYADIVLHESIGEVLVECIK